MELVDARQWLMQRGVVPMSPVGALGPALPTLHCLVLYFPSDHMATVSTAVDDIGIPPILIQIFPSPQPPISFQYYIWDDQIFSLHLRASIVEDFEMSMTPYIVNMLPHITVCAGANVTVLHLVFHACCLHLVCVVPFSHVLSV